jgi:hypothetical protein
MKKWLLGILAVFVLLLFGVSLSAYFNVQDRNPGYQLLLEAQTTSASGTSLKIGFAALPISPEITDTWTDANNDARYNPDDGDTYQDINQNGRFDPVWMAGFQQSRPAQGIHDDLWARTMLIDDGNTIISITALDAIGFGHDDVLDVRRRIAQEASITLPIISSTHTHEAPDLQGLWGPGIFKSGVDPVYMEYVKEQAAQSVIFAYQNRQAAYLEVAEDLESAIPLVTDSRKPEVLDAGLRMLRAVAEQDGATLGTLVSWGNHPETLWNKNLLITSDFPHYLREGVEKGISLGDSTLIEGLGGTCVFVNAAIGGLMTTDPDWPVYDPWMDTTFLAPTFEKAASQGKQLAYFVLKALEDTAERLPSGESSIRLAARSFDLPLDNPNFRLASAIGLLDRGYNGWMQIRSEVAAVQIGPISFITVPGEIYPEIINGGIESPEGQDFAVEPQETPPLRSLMPGRYRFVLGLANDQIGYIIPKSEWDEEAPYLYGAESSPYGEINSVGPETAMIVHREIKNLLETLTEEKIANVY